MENIQLTDLSRMSLRELQQLTPEQIEELQRQYRGMLMESELSKLTPDQLRFLGYDPENLSDVTEYSLNVNFLKDGELAKCSRYYTEHPEGVMLYKKNVGNSFNRNQEFTKKNGRNMNEYLYSYETLQSQNGLYMLKIFEDGNVVLFDNNSAEVWNIKKQFPETFKSIVPFEIQNYEELVGDVQIIELLNDIPTINTTLLPYMEDTRNTIKSYKVLGIRVNEYGDLIFDALFTEEYVDQTKKTYIIPYFKISVNAEEGNYEFLLNNSRTFEIRESSTLTTKYLSNTETNGLLYPITEDMYESIGIDYESLKTINCTTGSVMKSVSKLKPDVNDFKNGDLIYDVVTRDLFRVYNYKIGKMSEDVMKTWYYPKTKVSAFYENYNNIKQKTQIILPQYSFDNYFAFSFFFLKKQNGDVINFMNDSDESICKLTITLNNEMYLNDLLLFRSDESLLNKIHHVVIENNMVTLNLNMSKTIDFDFSGITKFYVTSDEIKSFRMYTSLLTDDDLDELYKNDIYSPEMKIITYDTYLFRRGDDYVENKENELTNESIVYFENDKSKFFRFDNDMNKFVYFVPNKFSTNIKDAVAIPFDFTFLQNGDLIYDSYPQKYYRLYNNKLGELPDKDVLWSWYKDDVNDDVVFRYSYPHSIKQDVKLLLGVSGFTVSFFLNKKSKTFEILKLSNEENVFRIAILDDMLFINDTNTSYRFPTAQRGKNVLVNLLFNNTDRIDIFIDDLKRSTVDFKYPQNVIYTKIQFSNIIDLRVFSRLLNESEIINIYKKNINSSHFPIFYVDTRDIQKSEPYEYLQSSGVVTNIIMNDTDQTLCDETCKTLNCKHSVYNESTCIIHETDIKKIKNSKFIYIENDKSNTYDAQTFQKTSKIQQDAIPIPFTDFKGSFTPSTTTTTSSSITSSVNISGLSKIQIIVVIILFIMFVYMIHKIFKNM